jgi:putative flippase GtrA
VNTLTKFLHNKSHVPTQFVKYGIAGVIGAATQFLVFALLNESLFPADLGRDGSERGWNFFWSFSVAFFLANFVAYFLNRRWVFQAGRHNRWVELGLFFGISGIAYLLGTPLGSFLVARFPLNEYFVFLLAIFASILVNFLGRKLVVFLH